MKAILVCFIVGVLSISCGKCSKGRDSYPELKKADELFEKGTFQEALEAYESVYGKSKDPEVKWRAFYRMCESLSHLFRYGDAAQKLLSTPLPEEKELRIRILSLRAELLQNFLMQYSYIQSKDIIDEEGEKDVFRLTPEQIKEKIRDSYGELWKMRAELVDMDLEDENYFLDVEGVDFGIYPTMFDYLVYSWTDYLLRTEASNITEKTVYPDGNKLLVEEFKRPVDFNDPPALLAAELMEEASRYEKKKREEACERWRVKRLMLPVWWTYFEIKDKEAFGDRTKKILLKWFDEFETRGGRAMAGYHAAETLNWLEKYKEAVEICEKVEKISGPYEQYQATVLRKSIQEPALNLKARSVLPPGKGAFTVETRNLKKIYFQIYKVDPETLKEEFIEKYGYFYGWSGLLSNPNKEWLEKIVSKKNPFKKWDTKIDDKGDYKYIETVVDPPDLDKGVYLSLVSESGSFRIDHKLVSACFLNVTDLVLVGTAGMTTKTQDAYYSFIENKGTSDVDDDVTRFYALDARTGKTVEDADINVYLSGTTYSASNYKESLDLTTGKKGMAELALKVRVTPAPAGVDYYYDYMNRFYVDPLAKKGDAFSYWGGNQYFTYLAPSPYILFLETDRPIYRPGHKVSAKVVAVKRTDQGYVTIKADQTAEVKVFDPNGKEFFTETVQLNDFGSGSVSFEIPAGRLLGQYRLSAEYRHGGYGGSHDLYFSVEEYKQPEFEMTLKPAEKPWKYGKPVKIHGSAKYYFGGPVSDASIKYIIRRQVYIPWFYRYWFGDDYMSSGEEIATGEMKTDEKGDFVISFTPTAPPRSPWEKKIPDIAEFIVEVEGRDSGGRTIVSSQAYKAGASALYFLIQPTRGFFLPGGAIEIESNLLTINDSPASGRSSYSVFRLADEPTKPLSELEAEFPSYSDTWSWLPPLDVQLKDAGNGKKVAHGDAQHDEEGKARVKLPSLPPGAYRIVQSMKDEWGGKVEQEKIFVVASPEKRVPVNAPSVMLVEKDEYEAGDTASFVIGSGLGAGIYHVEVWAGSYFLKSELIDGADPVTVVQLPVTEKMKGGFTVRWFGAKDMEVYYGQAPVSVPWSEKKLALALNPFDEKLTPGQEATWGVELKDSKGKPARGEVLALMYDRALEYYAASQSTWLDTLYLPGAGPDQGVDSLFDLHVSQFYVSEGILDKIKDIFKRPPEEPKDPGLRTWSTWAEGRSDTGLLMRTTAAKDEAGVADLEEAPAAPAQAEAPPPPAKAAGPIAAKPPVAQKAAKVEARKAFVDTAFFYPQIATSAGGTGKFSFTAPAQLTSWRIKLFAFTTDVKEGTLTEETVTKKDLMVRADLPRFFREKDKGTVTAVVHNESENSVKGNLFIDITEEGQSINDKLKLGVNQKQFEIEPHGLASFDWMLEIPGGISTYKVRVAAVAGKLTDAEERELPILPSRQRLIESAFVSLKGAVSKKLEIKLKDDPTRINETMVLQIDPQLTLSLLNTIPFLVEYPYECVEQILNRYVPMAIINEIYRKYPAIKKATSKIPKRETITPAWEQDDPRRLITLMETPWVQQSEGYKSKFPMIDLLDPAIVKAQKEITLDRLRAAQLPSGAFPWWPGGEPDPYITLYVLAGFAEAKRYGVELPKDMISRALEYVASEIPKRLKKEDRYLAIVAYAAYVVTAYSPKEFAAAAKLHKEAKSWVKFLREHVNALTPFGKAYLAYTYWRLGDKKNANEVLDMALDGAKEDPIVGVYWVPEKYSWVWYSDTVEKHAFFLKTLQELRPEDKRLPGMVQWLLFNRKGNMWKSTKASSAAIYSLLDYLNQIGALASKEVFNVTWGSMKDTVVVKPDDWIEEPIRWIEEGGAITPDKTTALIQKDGAGLAFASMTWTYTTEQLAEASGPGLLQMQRTFYRRVKEGNEYHLKPIKSGEKVKVGDEVVVQVKVNAKSQFEYMHLKDPKAAGFEAETLLSGWKYNPLSYYEEPRDSLTNFFISWLPQGEYIMKYTLRPTKPGTYRIGAATLQSMYAPEMTAHSAGFIINVE